MKYSKRMVLVPEDFMEMLERKENIQNVPLTKSLIRIDKKMDDVLEDTNKPTDDKVAQYNQNLQRFLDVQEKKRQYIPTVKIHQESASPRTSQEKQPTTEGLDNSSESQAVARQSPLSEDEILQSIPKNSRTLARSMINRLKANSEHVTWNSKGEITVNGHSIPSSNIIDLVNDQLRSRKDFNPKGWERFTETLHEMNMPKYLMRNEKRRSHIAQLHKQETPVLPKPSENYNNFPPTPPSTPKTGKTPTHRRFKSKRFSDNWIAY